MEELRNSLQKFIILTTLVRTKLFTSCQAKVAQAKTSHLTRASTSVVACVVAGKTQKWLKLSPTVAPTVQFRPKLTNFVEATKSLLFYL